MPPAPAVPRSSVAPATPLRRRDLRPLLRQATRFLLVGGVATVADVGLFNLLHYGVGIGPLTSKVASTVAGGAVAFAGNRQWSFGDQSSRDVRGQAVAFLVINAAALLLALVPLAVARYVLGLTSVVALNLAGNVIGLGLATVVRFEGYRRWVFRAPDSDAGPRRTRRRQASRRSALRAASVQRDDLAA